MEREVFIVAYGRSIYGKAKKGSFSRVHPADYGAMTLRGVLEKVPQLDPMKIDDVIVGCSHPVEVQDMNFARIIAQRAGLPDKVTGQTVNRFCASGIQALATGAAAIISGQADVVVAGGCESMSMIPMSVNPEFWNPWLVANRPDNYIAMGLTAENVADEFCISREEMEQMCCESHAKAAAAQLAGYFDDQIIPITLTDLDGNNIIATKDEGIRPETSMEILAGLKPRFKENGIVTSALASQSTDGAGFMVMMTKEKAAEMGVEPLAKYIGFAVDGVPARIMGMGPAKAVPKVLRQTGLKLADMDVIELNEAFASQAIACMQVLGMDKSKVNPEGGAMAHGHPLGASGAMLSVKALSHLRRCGGRYGLITMCIGGGQGAALVLERL